MFEEFQPYHGRRFPDHWSGDYIHELELLQILSNKDKHQTLVPILLPPTGYYLPRFLSHPSVTITEWAWSDVPLKVGAEAAHIWVTYNFAPPPRVDVEGRVIPKVSFPHWGPVDSALGRIHDFVSRVLREFEPLV